MMLLHEEFVQRIKELNPTVGVREAQQADGEKFVALFNSYYKRKTSLAYFDWQFFNSPFQSRLFLAIDDNKLIGYYGVKIFYLTNGLPAGFAVDLLIDEAYRKRGVVWLLESAVIEFCLKHRACMITALPNGYGNAAFKALGWQSINRIDTLVCNNPNSNLFDSASNKLQIPPLHLTGFRKDVDYRNWRFKQNPLYQYETVTIDDNNFAITKLFKDPVSGHVYGDIVDVEFKEEDHLLPALLKKVIQEMMSKNIKSITAWALPHTSLFSQLIKGSFEPVQAERFFCAKMLDEAMPSLSDIKNWKLVECDAEIF